MNRDGGKNMSETQPPRRALRGASAVFAGLVAIFVLSPGTDVVLHATGVMPPWGQPMSDALFVLALGYRIVFSVAGCYLTARLAPDRPMFYAMMLGGIGVVLSTAGAVATWNRGPEFGPHWYPVSLIVVAMPCAWLGGKLFQMRLISR